MALKSSSSPQRLVNRWTTTLVQVASMTVQPSNLCRSIYPQAVCYMGTVATPTMTGVPERQEELYADCDQITLLIHRKRNSKRPDEAWQRFLKKHFRKPIETVISQIELLFPRKIHAVTAKGFLLKVFLFVLAYAVDEAYISPINLAT